MLKDKLIIKGARVHNLKNIDIEIPKYKIVVFSGVSGSGKSSLVFNTIFEEGRARYLKELLPKMFRRLRFERPDVDYIQGLLPSIAIEQRNSINLNPRSIVGTSTEVNPYLRVLFAKLGKSTSKAGNEEMMPAMFSFNTPYGMCPRCNGLGEVREFRLGLIIPDRNKSLSQILASAIKATFTPLQKSIEALAKHYKFSLDTSFCDLSKNIRNIVLYGTSKEIKVDYISEKFTAQRMKSYPGIIPFLEESYKETTSLDRQSRIEKYMSFSVCPECKGARFKEDILAVKIDGYSIADFLALPIIEFNNYITKFSVKGDKGIIARRLIREIEGRLKSLIDVGLGYLTLDRPSPTLSAGEAQRVSLATHLGSGLGGLMYVLDEPTVGLHEREKASLINSLRELKELGNSVLVVEHDESILREADYIVDLGPGAGQLGGEVIAAGTFDSIIRNKNSITGKYLSSALSVSFPKKRRLPSNKLLEVVGAGENNLKNINVIIPLGLFVCITGVSGSGKSSLIQDILYPGLIRKMYGRRIEVGKHKEINGIEFIDKVVNIDQSPIGRSPRSNPISYVGGWDLIRAFFAELPEVKKKKYAKGMFSFNVEGGRCETCQGSGVVPIDIHFLSDVYIPCQDCQGRRYRQEILEIKYKGKNIADVLDLTFEEAMIFFSDQKEIVRILNVVEKVGMGYIKLGQSAVTLSGGEAQRIKLTSELKKKGTGSTLYILDEPTTGLHFADIHKLLDILVELVDAGNTVLVIEHNLDVIKMADHIIDLGPEGGDKGGKVITCGNPEEIMRCGQSYTGKYLKKYLNKKGALN